jgi:hypothetical protein
MDSCRDEKPRDRDNVIDLARRREARDLLRMLEAGQFDEDGEPGLDVLGMLALMDRGRRLESLPPDARTPEMLQAFDQELRNYLELF